MLRRGLILSGLGLAARARPRSRTAIFAAMEQVMGPFPRTPRTPVRVETLDEHREANFLRRKIRYESEPGCWVPAYLFLPVNGKRAAAILALHQTTRYAKDEPAGLAGNPNLHYARELASLGFIVLAPDYCRFGEYKIDPYATGYASATMKGIWDHSRGLDLLSALPEVRRGHIGAIGHSLGGHNSLFLAAFDNRVQAVVTSCGFTSFAKYQPGWDRPNPPKPGNLTGWSHAGYMPRIASQFESSAARMPFEFADVLRLILPNRVFVYAPLEDSNFEPSGVVDAIRDSAAGSRITLRQPHGTHDFPATFRQQAYEHLKRWL